MFQPAKVQKKYKLYKLKFFYFCNLTKNILSNLFYTIYKKREPSYDDSLVSQADIYPFIIPTN